MKSKIDWELVVVGVIAFLAAVFVVAAISTAMQDAQDEQRKQDKCLNAGGMWIDNRSTDSYCFFNK